MTAARIGACVALVCALLFAAAGVSLARSADPITAFAPLSVAMFMGVCACELWRGSGGSVVRSTSVENRSSRGASARNVDI